MDQLTIILSPTAQPGGLGGRAYTLHAAQFAKYRPAHHPCLTLVEGLRFGPQDPALPSGTVVSHWEAITPRLERVRGPRAGRVLLPTFTCPFPGRLADLDAWYTTFHVPQVIEVDGFLAGQRYRRLDDDPTPPHEHVRLALYELDPADPGAALERLQGALGSMEPTDALDGSTISSWCFAPTS